MISMVRTNITKPTTTYPVSLRIHSNYAHVHELAILLRDLYGEEATLFGAMDRSEKTKRDIKKRTNNSRTRILGALKAHFVSSI